MHFGENSRARVSFGPRGRSQRVSHMASIDQTLRSVSKKVALFRGAVRTVCVKIKTHFACPSMGDARRSPFDTFGLISACCLITIYHWIGKRRRRVENIFCLLQRLIAESALRKSRPFRRQIDGVRSGVLLSWLGRQLLALKILADVCLVRGEALKRSWSIWP